MITSKLTTRAQTTIPQPVRVVLRLEPGDELMYEIDGQRVIVRGRDEDPSAEFESKTRSARESGPG